MGHCGVRQVGHALLSEQCGDEVPVLLGLGGGQSGQHAGGSTQIEPNTEYVAGPNTGTGEDQHPMALERVAQLVHDRTEHPTAPVDDRATAEHHNVQPREEPDHVSADRADEVAIEQRRSRCPPGKHKNPAGLIGLR